MYYVEPFVGYAHVLRRVERKRSYAASDANPLLVSLHETSIAPQELNQALRKCFTGGPFIFVCCTCVSIEHTWHP